MRFRRALSLMAAAGMLAAIPAASPVVGGEKPASPKPQSRPATKDSKPRPQTQTAPAADLTVQSNGGITVRENYFRELPGIDLSTLTPKQKQKFLDRVNSENCTCGCPNDTIARCLVNDPKCPTVRGLAEKVLSEVKAGK